MGNVWKELHSSYKKQDWIDRPSMFAEVALPFLPKFGRLLELGAGYGQDSVFFAENGLDVLSTDLETASLSLNLKNQEKAIQEKIDVMQLDLKKPFPFENQSLDVVYAHLSLHYFDERTTKEIINEIKRLLKPGGILAFLVNSVNDPEYQAGHLLETDFFQIDKVTKRYFSVDSVRKFMQGFEVLLLDDEGKTYKDQEKGISNLIRFVGRFC